VERLAIADRTALLTAAAVNGAENYTPVDVGERVESWRAWLVTDPAAKPAGESFAERVARFQQQVDAQYGEEGVA
jgi:hypothetical protein